MPVDLQALYPRLIHLMLDTVFVVDRDNQIVFVSDACEVLLGYKACELVGTPITDYMHPDDLAATRASIVRVMNGQAHYDFRNRYVRAHPVGSQLVRRGSSAYRCGAGCDRLAPGRR